MPGRRLHRPARSKGRVILLLGSLGLSCAIAELFLAAFFPQDTMERVRSKNPRVFQKSELLPYELIPGSRSRLLTAEFETPIQINSHGYRDEEFEPVRTGGCRILAVGDSFTFGYTGPAQQSYPTRLEDVLKKRLERDDIEVINAGFAACYYPDTYYLYLKEKGLALEPDLVLIGFFIGNDVDHEKAFDHVWSRVDQRGLPLKIESISSTPQDGFLVGRTMRRRYRIPILRSSHFAQALATGLTAVFRKPSLYFNHWMYRRYYEPRTEQIIEKVKQLFLATFEEAAARGVPVVFVMIPAREQIYPEDYPFEQYSYMADYDLDKPQRIFAEFFKHHGMQFIDLTPRMRRHPRSAPLYYKWDGHWNRLGNEIAAEHIADYLIRNHLTGLGPEAALN